MKNTHRNPRQPWLLSFLLAILAFVGFAPRAAAAPSVVEEYFIPFDEDDILTASQHAYTSGDPLNCGGSSTNPVDPIRSFTSFVVGEDNTVVVYDHWEDGYEPIPNVKTQSTTEIWGDGDLTNGVAPGHANDLLNRGSVVTMKNDVVSTTRQTVVDYDGGDRLVTSGALSMTRSGWATGSETLMAGATEVYPTALWGTSFKLPVGEDYIMSGGTATNNRFEYTAATIQASQNNTQIQIDSNADGTVDTTTTIQLGESYYVNGGLAQNATIVSDKPVFVILFTADKCATYEADWYTLPHLGLFSDSYLGAVGTPTFGTTQIHVYNPNASAITVNWFTQGPVAQTPLNIPANSAVSVTSPNLSGQRFVSTGGEHFIALASISANSTGGPSGSSNATSVWDWGYTLVPAAQATNQIISTAWSPGRDPNSSSNPTANVSPIWLTTLHKSNPSASATVEVCVDYNNDGGSLTDSNGIHYDAKYTVIPLDSQIIYDPDGDQTGMRLWVCDGSDAVIAAAWGEDPNTAPTGAPSLDLGVTVLNGSPFSAAKSVALLNDVNGNGLYDVGDSLRYTILVRNAGALPFSANSIRVSDVFPPALTYVAGSTMGKLAAGSPASLPDDGTGTPFPLDGTGLYVPVNMPPYSDYTITFDGVIPSYPAGGSIVNSASVTDSITTRNPTITFNVENKGTIRGSVLVDTNNDNTGDAPLSGVSIALFTDPNGDGNPADGVQVGSPTTTGADGSYSFTSVTPGNYVVVQTQPAGYTTVADGDTTTPGDDVANASILDNRIPVGITAGEIDTGNDFVEEQPGTISGSVFKDTNNDNIGDAAFSGVTLTLFTDPNGDGDPSDGVQVGSSVTTSGTGAYSFTSVTPGNYVVVETQPAGYNTVTDGDTTTPGDDVANASTLDNRIPVGISSGESDTGNDFVEEQPGTISGSVFKDTNNDNTGDAAFSGVTITLFTDPNGDGDPSDGAQVGSATTTNGSGAYSFSNVPPGNYVIVETQPAGYNTVTDGDTTTPGDDVANASTTDNRIPVGITAGESDTGNDFVEEQPGSIAGSVLADTNNDDTGDAPISGVTLTLVDSSGNPVDGDPVTPGVQPITTTTNGSGAYLFTNVPPGTYGVKETQPSGYNSVSDVDGGNPDEIRPITVNAGQAVTGRDFVEEQLAGISGSVLKDTNNDNLGDAPFSGVTLTLFTDPNGDGDPSDGVQVGSPTTTNGTGAYSFTGIAPGSYVVVETQPAGYLTVTDGDTTTPGDDVANASTTDNRIPVALVAGETDTGNDFVEEQSGSIAGSVLKDTNNDDIGDAPISSVTLTLVDGSGNPVDGDLTTPGVQPITTTTAADGSYSFTNVPPGTYGVLEEQPAGYNSVSDVDGGNPDRILPITVNPGQAVTGRDFVEEQPGTISGSVLADTNNDNTGDAPFSGVTVTLFTDPNGDGDPSDGVQVGSATTTNGSGAYSFTNVSPGNYVVVETQPAGYNTVTDGDTTTPGDDVANASTTDNRIPVGITAGESDTGNDFVEEQPGSIAGSVLKDTNNDDTGDAPISGVTLTLVDSSGNPVDGDPTTPGVQPITTITDGTGAYLFTNVPPGTYGVKETQPPGYNSVSDVDGGNPDEIRPITVNAGQAVTGRDFVEEQPGTISGSVLADTNNDDIGDAPIPSATVTLFTDPNGDGDPSDGVQVGSATMTNGSGAYSFTNVSPGNYVIVETQPAGYNTVTDGDTTTPGDDVANASTQDNRIPVGITAGETDTGNDFVEEQPGSITGSVFADTNNDDIGDTPVPGVTLTLVDGSGNPVDGDPTTPGVQPITAVTKASGSYTFPDVPPGIYGVVETQPGGYGSVSDVDGGNPNQILPITVNAGQTVTGRDFVEEQLGSISGTVRADTNNDNTGDSPISGVTLTLVDGSGNPVDGDPVTPGVQPITTTTNGSGAYTFANLPPGTYGVAETQPAGYNSVSDVDGGNPDQILPITLSAGQVITGRDFVEEQPGSISGTVLVDVDNDTFGDNPLPGVTLTLVDGSGNPVDGDPVTPGVQPITTTTDGSGAYTFTNVPPGTYGVKETQPAGYNSVSDVDGGDPDEIRPITVTAGQAVVGQDFIEKYGKPTTWALWQTFNALGGQNGPAQNADGDLYDNLQEFAFCLPGGSGLNSRCPLEVVINGANMDAQVSTVTGIIGVTYTLEYISDLSLSTVNGGGWTPVTTITPTAVVNGDLTTLTYANLESIPALANGKGFVRVKVDLASPAVTTRTYAAGWTDRPITKNCETYSNPFLKCEVFSGSVTGNTTTSIDISGSVGSGNFATSLIAGRNYYVEVIAGPNAGHRWWITPGSTATTISVGTGTKALAAGALTGSNIAVQESHTFASLFPPANYLSGNSVTTADKILVYDPTSASKWTNYFLANLTGAGLGIHWVKATDPLTNRDNTPLEACQGIFIHHRAATVYTTQVGHVRQNQFACPLSSGYNLVAGGFPVAQSPYGRAMTWDGSTFNGFVGSVDSARSDTLLFWKGDTTIGAENYYNYWLVNAGFDPYRRWAVQSDNAVLSQDANKLFELTRAAFYETDSGNPGYLMPTGWTP